ncbi:hypothetical protein CFP56_031326 [Quercus suber]|uniref:Uncharacterized protein n=1 Tax=Quercus suber TaxID=58331 RepID=A0AAW0JKA1_QUESU
MARAPISTIMDQLGSLITSKFKDQLGSLFTLEFTSIVNVKEEVEKLNDVEERQVKEKAVNYRP